MDILNKKVSYQVHTWSSLSSEITIKEALLEIKSNTHRDRVSYLRGLLQAGLKDEYTSHKRTLPAVTFCGTFDTERKKEKLKTYNNIIVLDIDKLNYSELARCKDCLHDDEIVFSFWESPSKEGLKGLVLLQFNFEIRLAKIDIRHKVAFQKLAKRFKQSYNIELDICGSDTTRLCFFSYDPAIVIKKDITPFEINEDDLSIDSIEETQEKVYSVKSTYSKSRDLFFNPKGRNKASDRSTMSSIIKYLQKKQSSITYSYEEWFKVAMAIANSFTYDVGEKYFLKLSSFDKEKYDEINCKNFLLSCYESRTGLVNFSTVVYFANRKDYITKKQRDRSSEAVDKSLS